MVPNILLRLRPEGALGIFQPFPARLELSRWNQCGPAALFGPLGRALYSMADGSDQTTQEVLRPAEFARAAVGEVKNHRFRGPSGFQFAHS